MGVAVAAVVDWVGVPKLIAPTLVGLFNPRPGVEPNAGGAPRPGVAVGELKANPPPPPALLAAPNNDAPGADVLAGTAAGAANAPVNEPKVGGLARFNVGPTAAVVEAGVALVVRFPNENTPPVVAGAVK